MRPHWLVAVEALNLVAVAAAQKFEAGSVLYALGYHLQAEIVAEADNRAGDGGVVPVAAGGS